MSQSKGNLSVNLSQSKGNLSVKLSQSKGNLENSADKQWFIVNSS